MSGPASDRFRAIGTTITVAGTDPDTLGAVRAHVEERIEELDRAASRFRDDSELASITRSPGRPIAVSETLYRAIEEALDAARTTGGIIDPTVGEALERCGYDRDFAAVAPTGPALTITFSRVPGWRGIRLDPARRSVVIPRGVRIDLGATAKAGCADRAATGASEQSGCGVLVSIGGDIAVAGMPPDGGWRVRVADRHDARPDEPGVTVAISSGGLATSGTAARRWRRGGQVLHHVIDPSTGAPATPCWRTVTVAAASCLAANVASTAAVILGPDAPAWLTRRGHHARLVTENDEVVGVGSWPTGALDPSSPRSESAAARL